MNFAMPLFPNRESVIIKRPGGNIALIAADEFSALTETLYLLKSPKNATRLLAALGRANHQRSS